MRSRIEPRSGVALLLEQGQTLTVYDPTGEQVSDMLAFCRSDVREAISSGRSLDYAGRIYLTKNDALYSNRSRVMLRIVEDTVGRHDFMLTPCSSDTFRIIYGDRKPRGGCQENFERALAPYGIGADSIPVAFNIFMNVAIDPTSGELKVLPPRSRAGDFVSFRCETDLIVALTACSAPQSNNGSFKPIDYEVS